MNRPVTFAIALIVSAAQGAPIHAQPAPATEDNSFQIHFSDLDRTSSASQSLTIQLPHDFDGPAQLDDSLKIIPDAGHSSFSHFDLNIVAPASSASASPQMINSAGQPSDPLADAQ